MKDLPNPFWALLFMALGCALLMGCLFKITVNTTTVMLGVIMAVATAGTNLISGAFGYINGHKDGVASVSTPGATATIGIDPPPPLAQPVEPAQPKK